MLALRRVLPRAVSRSARPLTSSAQKLSVLLKEEWDDEQRSAGVSERLGVLIGGLQAKGGSIRDESGSAVVSITLRDGVVASSCLRAARASRHTTSFAIAACSYSLDGGRYTSASCESMAAFASALAAL